MTPFVYTVPIAAATVPRCEALYVPCKQGRQDRACGAIEGGYPMKSVESTHTSATVRCHDCFAALAAPPPEHISSNLAMLGNKVTQPCAHSAARAARAMGAPCQPRDPAVPAGCPMVSNGVQWWFGRRSLKTRPHANSTRNTQTIHTQCHGQAKSDTPIAYAHV
jgi:hypothetical protein